MNSDRGLMNNGFSSNKTEMVLKMRKSNIIRHFYLTCEIHIVQNAQQSYHKPNVAQLGNDLLFCSNLFIQLAIQTRRSLLGRWCWCQGCCDIQRPYLNPIRPTDALVWTFAWLLLIVTLNVPVINFSINILFFKPRWMFRSRLITRPNTWIHMVMICDIVSFH